MSRRPPEVEAERGAIHSPDRRWRYRLWRRWGPGPSVVFVGLNPSTADEAQDDPTIRRCVRFARDWGYDGVEIVNLYAWRSTQPEPLWDGSEPDPVGPDNDGVLQALLGSAPLVVAAWGAFPRALARAEAVRALAPDAPWQVLDWTKGGHPRHPLYAKATLTPQPWPVDGTRPVADGPARRATYLRAGLVAAAMPPLLDPPALDEAIEIGIRWLAAGEGPVGTALVAAIAHRLWHGTEAEVRAAIPALERLDRALLVRGVAGRVDLWNAAAHASEDPHIQLQIAERRFEQGSWAGALEAWEAAARLARRRREAVAPVVAGDQGARIAQALLLTGRLDAAVARLQVEEPGADPGLRAWLLRIATGTGDAPQRCSCAAVPERCPDDAPGRPTGLLKRYHSITDDCYESEQWLCLDCEQFWSRDQQSVGTVYDWRWTRSRWDAVGTPGSWDFGWITSWPGDGIFQDRESVVAWIRGLGAAEGVHTFP